MKLCVLGCCSLVKISRRFVGTLCFHHQVVIVEANLQKVGPICGNFKIFHSDRQIVCAEKVVRIL